MRGSDAMGHRMADPLVRRRVVALLAALVLLAWISIALAARGSGPFSGAELRDLSGVPVPPPQIEGRLGPTDDGGDLSGEIEELRRRVEGAELPPGIDPKATEEEVPSR